MSWRSNPFDQSGQTHELNADVAVSSREGTLDIPRNNEIQTLSILAPERRQVRGFKTIGRPFALDGCRRLPALTQDEINLMSALVSPIVDRTPLEMRLKFVEHKMLPKKPQVVDAQGIPSSLKADEARIKSVDFWSGNDFSLPMAAERAKYGRDEGRFQHL
jgi:hypothetical protein